MGNFWSGSIVDSDSLWLPAVDEAVSRRITEFMFETCGTCVVDDVVFSTTVASLSRLIGATVGVGNSGLFVRACTSGLFSSVGAGLEVFVDECDEFGESTSSIVCTTI